MCPHAGPRNTHTHSQITTHMTVDTQYLQQQHMLANFLSRKKNIVEFMDAEIVFFMNFVGAPGGEGDYNASPEPMLSVL